jgi:hypothetical protein
LAGNTDRRGVSFKTVPCPPRPSLRERDWMA